MQWWCAATDTAWTWSWQAYPGVWLFIAALGLAYGRLLSRTEPGDVFTKRQRGWWAAAGILLLWIALDWPVGALGAGYLASVHMVQFLLIGVAAPPLLLLGIPRATLERWVARPLVHGTMRVLGYPLLSMGIFVLVMAYTHWPPVVDTLMATQLGSFALDMMWLVAGLIFWWPVAVSLPVRSWLIEPYKVGYLIVTTLVNTGVFAYLTYSELPLYAVYELAPPVGSLSTRDDQLVAGLLMKVGGAVILWTAISILFYRWYKRSEADEPPRVPATRAASFVGFALLAVGLGACGEADEFTGVRVVSAVISEPVMGERAALYLRIENRGQVPDTLDRIEVEGAGLVSIHSTDDVGGMMVMHEIGGGLEVPARGSLQMRPGGMHVMLESLESSWAPGDMVPIVLHLRGAGALEANARVTALSALEEAVGAGPSGG
jgi:cytochrome c oxidase assembly factor CtaG/copper(I)-binding protein